MKLVGGSLLLLLPLVESGWRRSRRTVAQIAAIGVPTVVLTVSLVAWHLDPEEDVGSFAGTPPRSAVLRRLLAPDARGPGIEPSRDPRRLILGTDSAGQDIGRRIFRAIRYSVGPGLVVLLVGVGLGFLLGGFASLWEGLPRRIAKIFIHGLESTPMFLLVFLVATLSNYRLWMIMIGVGLILIPDTARGIIRVVETLRRSDFVLAAREANLGSWTILWREIVWYNARPLMISQISKAFVAAILFEVVLRYIGQGVQDGTSLGAIIKEGWDATTLNRHYVLLAGGVGAVVALIGSFSIAEWGLLVLAERDA